MYSLFHVCIREKSSIFVVFLHALLIFRLEFPFLSIVSSVKWIIQTALSLPVIVKFIFYWEPSASVSTMRREIPLKSNFHMGTHPLLLKYFDLLWEKLNKILQFQSGHFKSKHLSLLTASFKGVSGIGLMHPSHIKVAADALSSWKQEL